MLKSNAQWSEASSFDRLHSTENSRLHYNEPYVAGRLRVLLTPRNARHAPRNAGWAWSQASTTSIAAATRDPTKFANAWLARAQPASTLTTGAATSARRNRRKRAASSPSAQRATAARGRAPEPPAPPTGLGLAPCVPWSACTRGYGAYGASAALVAAITAPAPYSCSCRAAPAWP